MNGNRRDTTGDSGFKDLGFTIGIPSVPA
jgi:hypothetical protein